MKRIATVEDVAAWLNTRPDSVRRYVYSGRIPERCLVKQLGGRGGRMLFWVDELEKHLTRRDELEAA